MKTILITGGTGMIGTELAKVLLQYGYHIIILTRNPQKLANQNILGSRVRYAAWDIKAKTIDEQALQKADYIIHLAGAGVVDHKWTAAYKKEIVDSRIDGSKLIIHTLDKMQHHVKAFISASAIGWYGTDNKESLITGFAEDAPADSHFLGHTCKLWEESVLPVEKMGIRIVLLRIGIVLANTGGALAEFKKPIKWGIAAVLGNGKQIISWIHINDLCYIFKYALENEQMHGIYNAVAPYPVSNKTLIQTLVLAIKKNRFITMRIPKFILKLIMGERSIEILKSTTVSSQKIKATGYQYRFPTIEEAIKDLTK